MKNILVAVDFSGCTSSLINHAVTLAKALDSKIHLVHIVGSNTDAKGRYQLDSDEEFPEAKQKLRDLVKEIEQADVISDGAVIEGSPASSVIHEAEHVSADLILMGTHGHSLVGGALIGSASQGVLRHTSIPVYFVPVRD